MAENKKITQLDPVSSLTGSESFEVVQVGENRRISWTQIKSLLLEYFYTIFPSYFQSTITTSATPTPTGDYKENEFYITALSQNTILQAPSGTPVNGNDLFIRIYGDSSYTFGLNPIYRDITKNVPANTVAGKEMFMYAVYNSRAVKWDILAYKEEL